MRAWVVESLTAAGAMALRDIPMPRSTGDACLLRVEAAGVNFLDTLMIRGQYQVKPKLPFTPGIEVVGTVVEPGPDSPYAAGERIAAMVEFGGYADYAVVPRLASERVPEGMSVRDAAGLPIVYPTAFLALRQRAALQAGETVLIHAGAGGVGSAAIQLAKHWGARVIATAGPSGHAYLRQLGAEPVVYGDGLLERITALAPDGVDAAVDTVGTDEAIDVSLALVADRGRIVTIAAFQRGLELGIKVIGGAPGADHGTEVRAAARMELVKRVEAGTLSVLVAATYPLVEAADALRQLATGHTHGKIVLVP